MAEEWQNSTPMFSSWGQVNLSPSYQDQYHCAAQVSYRACTPMVGPFLKSTVACEGWTKSVQPLDIHVVSVGYPDHDNPVVFSGTMSHRRCIAKVSDMASSIIEG